MNKSFGTTIYSLWGLFGRKSKVHFCLLVFLFMVGALLETVSISLVFPFISAIVAGENEALGGIAFLAAIILLCFLVKSLYLYGLGIIKRKYIVTQYKKTSKALLRTYLDQDYQSLTDEDSSVLINNINKYTGSIFISIQNVLELLAELMIILMLLVYMCFLDVTISLALIVVYGLSLLIFHQLIFKKVRHIAIQSNHSFDRMSAVTREAISGIKEIKLYETKDTVEQLYNQYIEKNVVLEVKQTAYSTLPRYLIELITVACLLTAFLVTYSTQGSAEGMMSKLAVLALILIRVMPGVTKINGYFSAFYANSSVLERMEGGFYEKIKKILKYNLPTAEQAAVDIDAKKFVQTRFDQHSKLVCHNLTFSYNPERLILNNINLDIPHGTIVGLKGPSGIGKSTLLNVLTGLLEAPQGSLYVEHKDGTRVEQHKLKLRIGYLPQKAFLLNGSVKDNITFFREENDSKLRHALAISQFSDVVAGLSEGVNSHIGENGIALSGGQCQRLGLARALYDAPDILVLDEGTSALDEYLEEEVMKAVTQLNNQTIIIASHRESTLKYCDFIFELNERV